MKAFLNLRKGETIHRVMTTPWTSGTGGDVCWRLISKRRLDGRLEIIHFIRMRAGNELISAHVVCAEDKFEGLVEKIREAIGKFAPGLAMKIGPLSDFDAIEFGPYFIYDPGAPDGKLPPPAPRA